MWMLSTSLGDRSHRPTLTVARSCPRRLTSNVGIPNQAQSDQFRSCNPAARFDTCATLEYECTGQIGLLEKEVFFQHSLIYFTCIHAPRTTVYTKSHPFYIFWVLSPISPHLQCQSTRTLHMDLHMTRRMERINGSTREEEANSSTKKCKGPKNKNPRAMLKSNQKRHPASLSLMASITLLLLANLLILPSCKLSGSCFFSFFFCGVRVWVCFGLPPFLFRAHCSLDARLDPFFSSRWTKTTNTAPVASSALEHKQKMGVRKTTHRNSVCDCSPDIAEDFFPSCSGPYSLGLNIAVFT